MKVTVKTAQSPYEDDVREEMDVCDWLNVNPDVKAVLDGVLAEYLNSVSRHPFFPSDVIHAVAKVTKDTGELCKTANDVFYYDDNVIDRIEMHVAANRAAASAIRLLMEIGNLRGRQ